MKRATAKLTLALDSAAIRKAKRFARSHNKSVSQIVQDYFTALDESSNTVPPVDTLPPRTRRLMGILKGHPAPDSETELAAHVAQKHK
ncbi:MAG: antitoxin [Spirochaetales bacterium]|nr:antitoxin [Spirochaetales bacterium]